MGKGNPHNESPHTGQGLTMEPKLTRQPRRARVYASGKAKTCTERERERVGRQKGLNMVVVKHVNDMKNRKD